MLSASTLRAENSCDASLAIAPDSVSTLSMRWKGKIEGPMAACIMTAFAKVQSIPTVWRVSLALNSPGGNLPTAEEVVAALKHIRKTHRLSTIVWQGATFRRPSALRRRLPAPRTRWQPAARCWRASRGIADGDVGAGDAYQLVVREVPRLSADRGDGGLGYRDVLPF
jgi:hypothetical protein